MRIPRFTAVFTVACALFCASALACLPNQINVGGVCETPGGHSSERPPYELDVISGLEPEEAFLTEMEEVEEYVDVSQPNKATELRLECPLRPDCRQKPENESEKACGQHLPVPMTNPWTAEGEKTPRLAEYDNIPWLDMRGESHTCIRLRAKIRGHAAGHHVGRTVEPGSRLQIESDNGQAEIEQIWGFPGSLRLDRIASVGIIMDGAGPGGVVPMEGPVRIAGPTKIRLIIMKGDLYLEEVEARRVVLEGNLHLVNSAVDQLIWKVTDKKFFVGSCRPKKGCRGHYKILRGDNIPRSQ